jgi:hypothetical protein
MFDEGNVRLGKRREEMSEGEKSWIKKIQLQRFNGLCKLRNIRLPEPLRRTQMNPDEHSPRFILITKIIYNVFYFS